MLLFRYHWTHGGLPELFSAHWDCGWFLLFLGGGGYWAQTAFVLAELFFWTSVLDLTPPTLGWLSYIFFCWFWAFRSQPLEGGTVRNLVLMTQGPWAVLGLLVCNMIICCACISGFPFSCECACVWSPGFPGPPGLVGVSRWEAGHTLGGGTHSAAVTTLDGWPQILKLIHIHYLYSFYRPLQFHRCHSRIHCILPCLYSLSLLFSTEPSVLSYDIWFLDGGTDKNIQLHLLIISGFCDLSLM